MIAAVILAAVLLFVWYNLGFHMIDSPLDLVVAIVWWLVVIAIIAIICWAESRRRERMRVAYIGDGVIYNPDRGMVRMNEGEDPVRALERVLSELDYNDGIAEPKTRERVRFNYVVRSRKFNRNRGVWEGEVITVANPNSDPTPFSGHMNLSVS